MHQLCQGKSAPGVVLFPLSSGFDRNGCHGVSALWHDLFWVRYLSFHTRFLIHYQWFRIHFWSDYMERPAD